ncbi:MAG: hypothetical protein J0H67_06215 [Rhodospirillales bacterium]|nr:hypothetical protein [Rhodospirillales bacterium]
MPDLVRFPPHLAADPQQQEPPARGAPAGPTDAAGPTAPIPTFTGPLPAACDRLQLALIDTPRRWRDLVAATADLAF